MRKILPRKFYSRNTLKVAQDLLGCFLIREYRGKIVRAMITETEAYHGEDDLASHASKGKTPRTEVMYGEPGQAYIYMIYGMYHCLNVVTERKGFPAAVLIRGVEVFSLLPAPTPPPRRRRGTSPQAGEENRFPLLVKERVGVRLNGPGKLCKFLKIDRKMNKWDLTKREKFWIERRNPRAKLLGIKKSKRIGIDYAQHCREYLWRFSLKI